MGANSPVQQRRNRPIRHIALATGALLLIPLVLMVLTDEMNWGVLDFVTAGVLIFGTAATYELVARRVGRRRVRIAVGVALALAFFVVWVELATGNVF
jgi:6,7-dimethyl-8-ribityllumazine synthase